MLQVVLLGTAQKLCIPSRPRAAYRNTQFTRRLAFTVGPLGTKREMQFNSARNKSSWWNTKASFHWHTTQNAQPCHVQAFSAALAACLHLELLLLKSYPGYNHQRQAHSPSTVTQPRVFGSRGSPGLRMIVCRLSTKFLISSQGGGADCVIFRMKCIFRVTVQSRNRPSSLLNTTCVRFGSCIRDHCSTHLCLVFGQDNSVCLVFAVR